MTEQISEVAHVIQTKTYVRGAFLYSTDDGTGFQQKNRNRVQDQIIIEDKANLGSLKREIQSKKQEISKKKQKSKKQKQILIPIRDTPVEPLPQPMMDNNKCQRATQQQFEYFQTYISQKQKQKKFEAEQKMRIQLFEKQQDRFRKNEDNEQRKGVSIVLQKDERSNLLLNKNLQKKKGPSIKVVIKKKDTINNQIVQKKSQKKQQSQANKVQKQDDKNKMFRSEVKPQNDQQFQNMTKVRVIDQNQYQCI